MDVHYFAAARAAAGVATEQVPRPATLGELIADLGSRHKGTTQGGMSLAEVLARCTFLIDGARSDTSASLGSAQRVDCLPPFAGG
ncbi:molybdopterin biosynthesis protein MoaD2 [Corynebacterium atypicum]|uniref:Molybdopterin biosynthesis protein MoaD2 n=1 Tax=Corynebacterium atypicum TaxID=191610 RepID=A0ABN4DD77_9CORY|nr:MoaD/ThiS family protein [Corynebacterium atypicum]AIG64323.1 molybdopterin biosynthesis protein MoaD2 [Corynebacterium atypicum]